WAGNRLYPASQVLMGAVRLDEKRLAFRCWVECRCRQYRRLVIIEETLRRIHRFAEHSNLEFFERAYIAVNGQLELQPWIRSYISEKDCVDSRTSRVIAFVTLEVTRPGADVRSFGGVHAPVQRV